MSLGTGRKRTDEDEYEMNDLNETRSSEHMDRRDREASVGTILEEQPSPPQIETVENPAEALPPYIPPPPPAVIADTSAHRAPSRQSMRISGSGTAPRRLSVTRLSVSSSRRDSRGE
jgi:hypothetical protein